MVPVPILNPTLCLKGDFAVQRGVPAKIPMFFQGYQVDVHVSLSYVRCNIAALHKEDLVMRTLERLFARIFGPVFELLGDLPPRALIRVFAPF